VTQRCTAEAGFTLIELMVAGAILTVVISQAMAVFIVQQQNFITQARVLDIQEDARLVAEMMILDTRMAGFMVPVRVGAASIDGGTGGSDTFCVSAASVINDSVLAGTTGRFDRASLSALLGGSQSTVALVSADMDIDGDGTPDFTVDKGIIISGDTQSHCARITAVTSGSVTFTPATPAGLSIAITGARAGPALIYEVSGSGLRRNNLLISSQIEDIQVEFAVDSNDNGQIESSEFPVHDLNGFDTGLIRGIQVSVLARVATEDPDFIGVGRQAVANRTASGTSDGFRRRLVTVISVPRNLQ